MMDFELSETDEERRDMENRYYLSLLKSGFKNWQAQYALEGYKSERRNSRYRFGLYNNFSALSEEEIQNLEVKFNQREQIIEQYNDLLNKLTPLLEEEKKLRNLLVQTNVSICEIEGHRLSEEIHSVPHYDSYGYLSDECLYRECVICGKYVKEIEIDHKDIVVKNKSDLSILQRKIK